jgi:AraC-like DNA-binding protein
VPRHVHRTHQLLYAVAGAMTVHTGAGTFIVPPTRQVWVPRDLPHAIDMSGTVSMRTLFLSPSLWTRAPKQCRVLSVSPLLRALITTAIERGGVDHRRKQARRLYALQRLAAGESVTGAAFESGYAGVSAFIAAFRKTFGVTPGASFRDTRESHARSRRHQRRA